jgi:hypothetical protein
VVAALLFSLLVLAADPQPESAPGAGQPATPATPAATETPAASADETRLVCRRESQPNTRFKTKVCKTVAEWEARAEAARAAFAEEQQRPMISTARGN